METMWLTPLILLPGVAMLILSTSARFGRLHDELHHVHDADPKDATQRAIHLLTRARHFRNALVCLYLGVGFFALGGLVGALTHFWIDRIGWILPILTFLGVLTVLIAAVELIRESVLSMRIVESHCRDFRDE